MCIRDRGDTLGEHVWSLILPAFTQSLGISALLIRNMQNEVAQIFTIDYVDFARSKGLAPMRVRVWYILRNVMILSLIHIYGQRYCKRVHPDAVGPRGRSHRLQ